MTKLPAAVRAALRAAGTKGGKVFVPGRVERLREIARRTHHRPGPSLENQAAVFGELIDEGFKPKIGKILYLYLVHLYGDARLARLAEECRSDSTAASVTRRALAKQGGKPTQGTSVEEIETMIANKIKGTKS